MIPGNFLKWITPDSPQKMNGWLEPQRPSFQKDCYFSNLKFLEPPMLVFGKCKLLQPCKFPAVLQAKFDVSSCQKTVRSENYKDSTLQSSTTRRTCQGCQPTAHNYTNQYQASTCFGSFQPNPKTNSARICTPEARWKSDLRKG